MNLQRICLLFFNLILFNPDQPNAQVISDSILIQDTVMDFDLKQPLAGVLVHSVSDSTLTDERGHFMIKVLRRDSLFMQYMGYRSFAMPVRFMGNQTGIYLRKENATMLQEVEAVGNRYQYVRRPVMDTLKTYYLSHKTDTVTKRGESRKFGGVVSELAAQFSKKEQERRKHLDIRYAEKFEASYWKTLDDPLLFEHFQNQYGLDEAAFLNYKDYFIRHTDSLKISHRSDQVLKYFHDLYRPYLQAKNN